jgi:hypothetical protein
MNINIGFGSRRFPSKKPLMVFAWIRGNTRESQLALKQSICSS